VVLDASVAAKWVLPGEAEPLQAEALDLRAQHAAGSVRCIVPDLFWSEIGNILGKSARKGRISWELAARALDEMLRGDFQEMRVRDVGTEALILARIHGLTFYDAAYLAVAAARDATLITADTKLAATATYGMPVLWLGAI
jgi:predicted nucleic acid-binding protein